MPDRSPCQHAGEAVWDTRDRRRTQHDVREDLIVGHLDVANGDTQAENLLELELDRRADLGDLVLEVLGVRDGRGELAGLGETGAEQTRNLLDEGLGGKESIVLFGELLHKLLVLVKPARGYASKPEARRGKRGYDALLQVINGHVLKVDRLGAVDVGGICENADGHARAGDMGELDGARETLVALGVVVLETNLELDGLDKVALLLAV